jgi:hypothetical protein
LPFNFSRHGEDRQSHGLHGLHRLNQILVMGSRQLFGVQREDYVSVSGS